MKKPLLVFRGPHQLWFHKSHKPLAGSEKAAAGIWSSKPLQLAARDVERLRGQKGIDEEVCDAVAADKGDRFRKFGGAKIPVSSPVGMVETFHE